MTRQVTRLILRSTLIVLSIRRWYFPVCLSSYTIPFPPPIIGTEQGPGTTYGLLRPANKRCVRGNWVGISRFLPFSCFKQAIDRSIYRSQSTRTSLVQWREETPPVECIDPFLLTLIILIHRPAKPVDTAAQRLPIWDNFSFSSTSTPIPAVNNRKGDSQILPLHLA